MDLNTKTNAELVEIHNAFNLVTPLKYWKSKKSDLIERIQNLQSIANESDDTMANDTVEIVEIVKVPEAEVVKMDLTPAEAPVKVVAEKAVEEKKSNRGEIKRLTIDLLRKVVMEDADGRPVGLPYDAIMHMILVRVPDAKPSIKSLQWYASKLNMDEALPLRPRRKSFKAPKATKSAAKAA